MTPNLRSLLFIGGMVGGIFATALLSIANAVIDKAKA